MLFALRGRTYRHRFVIDLHHPHWPDGAAG